jgi:hypothetical protein
MLKEQRGRAKVRRFLDNHFFDLIETHVIPPAIIELSVARRGMVRHRRRLFQRAAFLEISRDPRCPETMAADLGVDRASI